MSSFTLVTIPVFKCFLNKKVKMVMSLGAAFVNVFYFFKPLLNYSFVSRVEKMA